MRSKLALLLFITLAPLFSYAQGCITVFSEDGDPFFLVLNGVKQNTNPQTNVHIDGLPNEFYSAKILFADQGKEAISKNIPVKDPATGQFADVTYKIKKGKDGAPKLRYFGATPVPVNYAPPADMYVVHYGEPAPPQGTVTQTTVTTTTTNGNSGNGSVTIGTGMGGVNMNININDPNATVQQTTTTTSYSQTQSTTNNQNTIQRVNSGCNYPMPFSTFKDARESVKKATFEETKLSTAKAVLASNCISTDQVIDMCRQFTFEASKLDFAKYAYSKTTDQSNYFKVANVFTYDASKTELNDYISK
ncbi:MAG: hypothetical protein JWQ38_307 [Flavipsychrobacter sp.]|nr:hypothetical protein [Flavipsychrobacter sp.]